MHLITGYAGREHVSAADQGAFNAAVISTDKVVLPTGERFRAEKLSSSLIRINSGDALINGRHVNIPYGQSEKCIIDSCGSGFYRSDVIAIRYTKNVNTLIESAELVVLKGVPGTDAAPLYPPVADGNILEWDTVCEFPLYHVQIAGAGIVGIKQLFRVTENVDRIGSVVSQIKETMDIWANAAVEDAEIETDECHIWGHDAANPGYLCQQPMEAEGGYAQSAKIAVHPGETYKITAQEGYYTDAFQYPLIAAAYYAAGEIYEIMRSLYSPLAEGGSDYLVTIPDNCNYLLINSCSRELRVQKVRAGSKGGGMKILWNGLLKGSAGMEGARIEFTIPEECFFSGGKELIIAVNGYCPKEQELSYSLYTAGMCFGKSEDFGLVNADERPYLYGYFDRTVYVQEAPGTGHYLNMTVNVQKVPDSRYAVCTLKNASENFYITSISAAIPG